MKALDKLCEMFDRKMLEPEFSASLHPRLAEPLQLPLDYTAFIRTFGEGHFGPSRQCGLFQVANLIDAPTERWMHADILFEVLHDQPDIPSDAGLLHGYPRRPGLLPWGGDDQGTTFYWVVSGAPDSWNVGVGRLEVAVFELTMTEFLLSCVTEGFVYHREKPPLDCEIAFFELDEGTHRA